MDADDIVRDVEAYGECPKCGTPGLHLMPYRVLLTKMDPDKVSSRRQRVRDAEDYYYSSSGRGTYYYYEGEAYSWRRRVLEEARVEYHAAVRAAEHHVYALKRVCYVDECRHEWFELIRKIKSDVEASSLRERYRRGLVVQAQ